MKFERKSKAVGGKDQRKTRMKVKAGGNGWSWIDKRKGNGSRADVCTFKMQRQRVW